MAVCFACKKELKIMDRVGRRDTCSCGADLHCCRNCQFYDPGSYNECHEPVADRVVDKTISNFCEYFKIADRPFTAEEDKVAEAKRTLAALFQKK